jgi:uncharacterized protein YndB with AHSA1/START domain
MNDFTTTFAVPASPERVFEAINDVRSWWEGDITGETRDAGDVFVYEHLPEHRSVQRITESRAGERIAWHVDDAHLSFVDDVGEWAGTDIIFELAENDGGTVLTFSHRGLVPEFECYAACSSAWSYYINGKLRQRLESL